VPVQKADLSRLSITQLVELTRKDNRTITKRLRESGLKPIAQDGKTIWYAPELALAVIFGGASLDPAKELAKLNAAKREMLELQLSEKRHDLVPAVDVDHGYIALATSVSALMLSLPSALALELASEPNPAKCQEILEKAVHGALTDLANAGARAVARVAAEQKADEERSRNGSLGNEAAAEDDGPPVGRGTKGRSSRNKPRARKVEVKAVPGSSSRRDRSRRR